MSTSKQTPKKKSFSDLVFDAAQTWLKVERCVQAFRDSALAQPRPYWLAPQSQASPTHQDSYEYCIQLLTVLYYDREEFDQHRHYICPGVVAGTPDMCKKATALTEAKDAFAQAMSKVQSYKSKLDREQVTNHLVHMLQARKKFSRSMQATECLHRLRKKHISLTHVYRKVYVFKDIQRVSFTLATQHRAFDKINREKLDLKMRNAHPSNLEKSHYQTLLQSYPSNKQLFRKVRNVNAHFRANIKPNVGKTIMRSASTPYLILGDQLPEIKTVCRERPTTQELQHYLDHRERKSRSDKIYDETAMRIQPY